MIQLKEVIHYYIGQRFLFDNQEWKIVAINRKTVKGWRYSATGGDRYQEIWHRECRPILRRLEDMTEEEIKHIIGWERMNVLYRDLRYRKHEFVINVEYIVDAGDEGCYSQFHQISLQQHSPQQFHYLLQQGFDLFGLIDSNQAIDTKTLKQ